LTSFAPPFLNHGGFALVSNARKIFLKPSFFGNARTPPTDSSRSSPVHADTAPSWALSSVMRGLRGFFLLSLAALSGFPWSGLASNFQPPAEAVASAHPLATQAGTQILLEDGNAFDAAVAVTAALAVVEPYSSGLGGGGFWLLHRASDGFEIMIDGRECAPLAAYSTMYRDPEGEVVARLSVDGALAAGVPGTVAAMVHLSQHYGKLPLEKTLAPAIALAQKGFPADEIYRRRAKFRHEALRAAPAAAEIFLVNDRVPEVGRRIRQPRLADALRLVAREGREGFYAGELAERLVEGVRNAGGIWTRQDLQRYRVVERPPIYGEYRGVKVVSAAPPSSGGVMLREMLNILAGFPLAAVPAATRVHLITESMRRAYRDRALYLGDPDFVDMPLERLGSPFYAAGLRSGIRLDQAGESAPLPGIEISGESGRHTSHFSILDRDGNRVAATLSVNYPFGSGFVPPGTGILLNDEMDDFAAKPGRPNVYGLVGAEANAIAPGKRMLSSMSPTFLDDGHRVAILGTPGGSRIISMLLLASLEFARGADAQSTVNLPRFHHQYLPDELQLEPHALAGDVEDQLRRLGHATRHLQHPYGNMQIVIWDRDKGVVTAASDERGIGSAHVRRVGPDSVDAGEKSGQAPFSPHPEGDGSR
jgi:gamma-glutamyltranspeptidase/glutathione hydrolase